MEETNDNRYIKFTRVIEIANKYRIFKRTWLKKHNKCVSACMTCGIDFGNENRVFGGITRKGKIYFVCEKCVMEIVKGIDKN